MQTSTLKKTGACLHKKQFLGRKKFVGSRQSFNYQAISKLVQFIIKILYKIIDWTFAIEEKYQANSWSINYAIAKRIFFLLQLQDFRQDISEISPVNKTPLCF